MAVRIIREDKGLEALVTKMEELKTLCLDVGYLDSKRHKGAKMTIAQLAYLQETGFSHSFNGRTIVTPARPFLSTSTYVAWGTTFLPNRVPDILSSLFLPNRSSKATIEKLGRLTTEFVKDAIDGWTIPENAPYTVKLKGFNNPLVETGQMRDSVQYKVRKGAVTDVY